MYDRLSGSLWSQALGEEIVGTHAGEGLKRIPFDLAYWKDWKRLYPNSMVLSTDTGFTRPYGVDPYGDYYTSDQLFFPISNIDKRLGLKEMVVGLDDEGQYKAYILHQIESSKVIDDKVDNKSIVLFSLYPRMVRAYSPVINRQTLDFQYIASTNKILVYSNSFEVYSKSIFQLPTLVNVNPIAIIARFATVLMNEIKTSKEIQKC